MSSEEATIEALRRWSHILLWVSIVLPALGALAAGARYYVERYEKRLSGRLTAIATQEARQDATATRTELGELKEKTAPRHVSAEQRAVMLPFLAKIKGRPVAVACRLMDGESCDYATELATFLLGAGCAVPEPIRTSLNDLPGYLGLAIHGNADPEVAKVLASAFQAAGIPAKTEAVKQDSVGAWYQDAVHVIVGRKAP